VAAGPEKKKPLPDFARMNKERMQQKAANQQPVQKPEPKAASEQQKAEAILAQSKVTFASTQIRQRVLNALVAHMKGVRKPFETRQQLAKSVAEGGAGLEAAEVERIMTAAGGGRVEERPEMDISRTKQPVNEVMPAKRPPVAQDIFAPAAVKPMQEEPIYQIPSKPAPAVSAPAVAPKPRVADVQKPARAVVGLSGQLSYSLADWRRVAVQPRDRVKKIETQLDVLEQEGLPERLRGLRAWRDSEVMRLYLESGKESLEQGTPLQQMLGAGKPDALSWDEWTAIAELNERLKY